MHPRRYQFGDLVAPEGYSDHLVLTHEAFASQNPEFPHTPIAILNVQISGTGGEVCYTILEPLFAIC